MEKYIGLFYFSGTGNTKVVTKMIESELSYQGNTVETYSIDALLKEGQQIALNKYELIGIGYPILGFGAPKIVKTFIKQLPKVKMKNVFLFQTGADFIKVNHNTSNVLIKKLNRKGYQVDYDRIICMGSNFLIAYDDELVKQLYIGAKNKVSHMCKEVLDGNVRRQKVSFPLKWFTNMVHWFEEACGARIFGRSLKTRKACNQCGQCMRNCPTKNIQLKKSKIIFSWHCNFCMRCIYNCPQKAITSRGLSFLILKDGYAIDQVINNPNLEGKYITKDTKGYMGHFYKYFEDEAI